MKKINEDQQTPQKNETPQNTQDKVVDEMFDKYTSSFIDTKEEENENEKIKLDKHSLDTENETPPKKTKKEKENIKDKEAELPLKYGKKDEKEQQAKDEEEEIQEKDTEEVNLTKNEEEIKKDQKEKNEEKEDKKQLISPEIERQLLEKHNLTKFKTIEDALTSYKELESALGKAQALNAAYQKGVIPDEIKEGVAGAINIISRPRVKFDLPKTDGYFNDDGTFDIENYIQDALESYTVNLQKSLVFGELASALYTVLSQSVAEKGKTIKEEIEREKTINQIANEIETYFPQIKEDKDLGELFTALVEKKHQEKQAPLTRDEFIEIAKKVVSLKKVNIQKQEEEEKLENVGVSGQMSSDDSYKPNKSTQEKAVDELFERHLIKSSIF